MKKTFILFSLSFAFFIGYSPLQAQTQEAQVELPNKLGLRSIGATLGIGATDMNLNEINDHLQVLGIGRLDNMLSAYNFSIYTGFNGGFGLSIDVNGAISLGSELYNSNSWITLKTFSFGPTFYYPLFTTNRIRLMAVGGLRDNDMSFEYNANTNASPGFDNLLANPAANSNAIILESISTESATFGARFQYRLGKKENLKPREYSIGIDSGYNYSFDAIAWREPGSKNIIRDMPAIKPDHFYLNFTFSALLLR